MERGSTISVLGAQPDTLSADVAADQGQSFGRATATGAGAGAIYGAAGGAAMGLACGPFFLVCSPVMAVTGLAGGAIGGAIVGGTVLREGGRGPSISEELIKAFEGVIENMAGELDLSQLLVAEFTAQTAEEWEISGTGTGPQIILKVEQLYLGQGPTDMFSVRVVSSMTVYYGPTVSETTRQMLFPYASSPHDGEYWTADSGAAFREAAQQAFERQVTEMIAVLKNGSLPSVRSL